VLCAATLANAGTNIIAINVASVTMDFMEEDAVRIPAYPILCADNDAILKNRGCSAVCEHGWAILTMVAIPLTWGKAAVRPVHTTAFQPSATMALQRQRIKESVYQITATATNQASCTTTRQPVHTATANPNSSTHQCTTPKFMAICVRAAAALLHATICSCLTQSMMLQLGAVKHVVGILCEISTCCMQHYSCPMHSITAWCYSLAMSALPLGPG
jgi:hypothetical protein